jgi:CHAD domain-containing protein
VKIHATTTIAETLAQALKTHARTLVKRSAAAIDGPVDVVRRARVASRRLRETLGIVRDAGVRMGAGRVERETRQVTRAFGPVREIDVAMDGLIRVSKRHEWPAAAAVHRHLDTERARRRRPMLRAIKHLEGQALVDRCDRIAKAIERQASEQELWQAITRRVQRRTARVTSVIEACGTLYDPERLHALRIAIKKLRYALEFARGTRGVEVDAAIGALKHAQQRFGHLHDMQVLQAEIGAFTAAGRRRAAPPDLSAIVDALERDCRRIHARILPHLPALRAQVDAIRRDIGARSHGRRLTMAKARVAHRVDQPGVVTGSRTRLIGR